MTRTTTTDASEGLKACVDVLATLEGTEPSPTSPMLEGETTLKAFLLMQRRRLAVKAAAPTHLYPAFLATKSVNNNREAAAQLR
jgi:hypothetical protein